MRGVRWRHGCRGNAQRKRALSGAVSLVDLTKEQHLAVLMKVRNGELDERCLHVSGSRRVGVDK